MINACNAAADELKASRLLIEALEAENRALKERLETEKHASAMLAKIAETLHAETEALRTALAAKNETITAKDSVIAAQDKLIESLKAKKTSPWRRLGDILIGAAIATVLK